MRLEFPYTEAELALLAAHDSDAVNRWDAAQRTYANAILLLAKRHTAGESLALPHALITVGGQLLADSAADPALVALALTPPDLGYLAGLVEMVDVDALVAAREWVIREFAHTARHALEHAYNSRLPRQAYAPTQEQIGARSLRNLCLRYLGAVDDAALRALAAAQFDAADNMTDAIAALAAVNNSVSQEREFLFARFEAKWRDEPLVLDKWFALQATAQRADTLARVRMLLDHPKFNARNPNRVRSLVAAFALRNWHAFHARDGSGYAFVADQVMSLDRVNPHLSSMLAKAFNQWRRFAEPRRAMQRSTLEDIGRGQDLSPDLREIITRNLSD